MEVDRYCVFGNPVAHSKSPLIHAAFAAQTGQHITYQRRLAPLDGFAAAVRQFIDEGGRGANVTVPFKLEACALAPQLTTRARAAGAVNTLSFSGAGSPGSADMLGDNTDGAGLVADIVQNAGLALAGARILLLGAGGAARGVLLPLLEQQPGELVLANRSADKAAALVSQFAVMAGKNERLRACPLEQLEGRFDLVINATSASLHGALPALAPQLFDSATLALDMVYGDQPSVFMDYASAQGARVRDGLGMLVEQAAEAFLLWRGVRPDSASVLAQLRNAP